MAMSNVELYEALKGSIPEAAARVIAENFRPAGELATRHDLELLRSEMHTGFAAVREEIHESSASTMRWMLTFFIPVWAGSWGTVAAVLLKG